MIYYAIAFNKTNGKYDKIRLLEFDKDTILQKSKVIDINFSDLYKYKIKNIKKNGSELISENGSINRYPIQEENTIKNKNSIIILYRTENGFIITNSIGQVMKVTAEIIIKNNLKIANGKIVDNKFISAIEGEYEMFCEEGANLEELVADSKFKCDVVMGKNLLNIVKSISHLVPRYFTKDVLDFLNSPQKNCIGVIYGVRRTGKTYGIYCCISELLKKTDKVAFISFDEQTNLTMKDLFEDINKLKEQEVQYIFIDEITYLKDFLGSSNRLSNIYVPMGIKIIIAGTNSLALNLSQISVLFGGRLKTFDSTFMSYKEFSEVCPYGKDKTDFDNYLLGGGIFNISDEYLEGKKSGDKVLDKYLVESISDNIADSIIKFIPYDRNKNIPLQIKTLVKDKIKLKTALEKIIDNQNEEFLIDILNNEFYLANEVNFLDNFTEKEAEEINRENIIKKIKERLSIDETKSYDYTTLTYLKKYLKDLHIMKEYNYYLDKNEQKRYLMSQPALRYYQIKVLVNTFFNDTKVVPLRQELKDKMKRQLLRYIKGFFAEHTIMSNFLYINDNDNIHLYQVHCSEDNSEVDMALYDENTSNINLYEIKYINDSKPKEDYAKYISETKGKVVNIIKKDIIGDNIKNRVVLYKGDSTEHIINNKTIKYRKIDDILKNLSPNNIMQI